jgi:hypothetical protein
VQSRSRFSDLLGSRLMILLVAVAVIIVAFLLFRASRAKSTATAPPHVTAARVTKHSPAAVHRSRTPAHKAPKPLTPAQLRARAMTKQRKHYAARIVPVMDRSSRIFDGAAKGVASANGDFNALQQSCTYWGPKVQTIESEYEGIPHPFLWWTPAGTLHHQVSGDYHYMLGAIQNCEEAVQGTDSDASSVAVSQIAAAARNLHNRENYARYLATH